MEASAAPQATDEPVPVSVRVNGEDRERTVAPRRLLSDFVRHDLGLTGTRVGCEHGVCGACTVLVDGRPVRSCLLFAVQVDGSEVETVESLAADSGGGGAEDADALHPLQAAFRSCHGLQCGFCTAGMLMALVPFLEDNPDPTEEEIRSYLSGHLCRCTGYQFIVEAVEEAAAWMRGDGAAAGAAAGDGPGSGEPAPEAGDGGAA